MGTAAGHCCRLSGERTPQGEWWARLSRASREDSPGPVVGMLVPCIQFLITVLLSGSGARLQYLSLHAGVSQFGPDHPEPAWASPAKVAITAKQQHKGRTWEWQPLEKGMATHSSILAWRIPRTEEPGGLYSPWGRRGSDMTERVSLHFNSTKKATHTFAHFSRTEINIHLPKRP